MPVGRAARAADGTALGGGCSLLWRLTASSASASHTPVVMSVDNVSVRGLRRADRGCHGR
jgi:hypothetical protein